MIREVTEKEKDAFNKAAIHPLQSWEWGEFRKKNGNSVIRLGVFKNNALTDTLQITFSLLPGGLKIGTHIRGPIPTKEIMDVLFKLGRKEHAIFIKLEPFLVKTETNKTLIAKTEKLMRDRRAVRGKTLFTPTSFWVDLTQSEEELMKSFHSKTRYNIRLAQRKGVEVYEDNSDKAFKEYLKLFFETTKRQGYYMHTEKYHKLMWQTLHTDMVATGQTPIARLLVAKYKGEILTTWMVLVWHDFLYYPYGGSSDKYREVMSNNLMMWEAIRYGKKFGLTTFDLWGREEGKGFTKFKEGYNPKVVEFIGTWDLPTSPLYKAYTLAEKMRWKLLRAKARLQLSHHE